VVRRTDAGPLVLLIRDSYGNWGLPKGHLERGERAASAAEREVREETGLTDVRVLSSIDTIQWRFRFRGTLVHKRCEFFLMESAAAATRPQRAEGITACRWTPMAEALEIIGYDNARDVLRQAQTLVDARPASPRTPA
jgi:8-oxo-dGTP diphosphatase